MRFISTILLIAIVSIAGICYGGSSKVKEVKVPPAESPADGIRKLAVSYIDSELKNGKNILISSLSIDTALGMLANGVSGDAVKQMESFLGGSAGELNDYYKKIIEDYNSQSNVTLNIANKIFINDFQIKDEFNKSLKNYFNAEAQVLNFKEYKSVAIINGWVSEKTHNLINKIVDQLDDSDKLILVNTLYFKGDWARPFEPDATKNRKFTNVDGTNVQTPFMYFSGGVRVYENKDITAVVMEYKGSRYTFVALMPNDIKAKIGLTMGLFDQIDSDASLSNIQLHFPKLDIEYESSLVPFLTPNIGNIFIPGNLNGISDDPRLAVSDVIHKTRLKLDENGTEAAAVTAIGIRALSFIPAGQEIVFDRPFIFYIWDSKEKLPVFTGAVNKM